MVTYPFESIYINGRTVSLEEIKKGTSLSHTSFELSTFLFIKDWLNKTAYFTLSTSGSTGTPKEIIITREQMIASARLTQQAIGLKSGFNALVCLDTKYIAGKMMLARSLEIGMKIFAVEPSSNPLEKMDSKIQFDFAAFVPLQLQTIVESENSHKLDSMHAIIVGGAPINHFLSKKILNIKTPTYLSYGMTETISHIALQKLNGLNSSDFFYTLPGIDVKIDDRNCLIINCPYLSKKIHTNDIVEIKSPTKFKWIGRYDNIINSGGVKISPEKLETEIQKILGEEDINRSFFVAGLPDHRLGQKIVLVIEGENLRAEVIEKINLMFKHTLSLYEIPKDILFRKLFFFTDTSKINRLKTIEFVEN